MTSPAIQSAERRQFPRHEVDLRVIAHYGSQRVGGRTVDMSEGGICVAPEGAQARPDEGEAVELEIQLPGGAGTARLAGQVRWHGHGGRWGVEFFEGLRGRALQVIAAATVGLVPVLGQAADSVPSFDPNADISLDGYEGGERPDETKVQSAFEATFGEIDQCVEKARKGKPLPGDAHLVVLLDPHGEKPLGVNAELAPGLAKNKRLNDCIRVAASHAHYPAYDGPPVVVNFEFELDPGFAEEAEE